MKIQMLTRFTAPGNRKLEPGMAYDLPGGIAQSLVDHGLAILVMEEVEKVLEVVEQVLPVAPMTHPGFVNTQRSAPEMQTRIYATQEKKSGSRSGETKKKKAKEDGES